MIHFRIRQLERHQMKLRELLRTSTDRTYRRELKRMIRESERMLGAYEAAAAQQERANGVRSDADLPLFQDGAV